MRRRLKLSRSDSYGKRECRKCGKPAIPPLAARYCSDHIPQEEICCNCNVTFEWRYGGPGLCPSCYIVQKELIELHRGDPNWTSGDTLRELARRTNVVI